MRSFVVFLPRGSLRFLSFTLLVGGAGCGLRATPPGAGTLTTSGPGMSITYLRWDQGLRVLFVDDVPGQHGSHGTSSTANPVATSTVSAGSLDAGGYQGQLQTRDGKSANCRINGKEYDLSQGALFVIKAQGQQVEVHQLQRDLTAIPFDAEGCREPLEKDPEIRKLLGLGDLPR